MICQVPASKNIMLQPEQLKAIHECFLYEAQPYIALMISCVELGKDFTSIQKALAEIKEEYI